jgi:KUP system potassium uptake protein
VESKVLYSIFKKLPKRADTYWFLHVNKVDDPYRFEYKVNHIIPGVLIRIDFDLGFKVDPKINLYFNDVLDDMVKSGEIKLETNFNSLKKYGVPADFRFVLIDRLLIRDFKLSNSEIFILAIRSLVRNLSIPEEKALHLDMTRTIIEQVPINIDQPVIKRIEQI